MQIFAYLLLLVFAPSVYADIFTISPQDESVLVLGTIFGANIGPIYLGGTPNGALPDLMQHFNSIIVGVGSVIVSYITVLSTIKTAHEGAVMGEKWSAIWIPIRSIAGILLMIPTPGTGYSMVQVTVTYIVLQGIGAADEIWTMVMQGLANGVSATAGGVPINSAQLNIQAAGMASAMLNAAICMQTFNAAAIDPANNGSWYYGKALQAFAVQSNQPTTNANGGYSTSGTINFGLQSDPNHQAVCGSVAIAPSTAASDYSAGGGTPTANDVQTVYTGEVNTMLTVLGVWQHLVASWTQNNIAPQMPANSQQGKTLQAQNAFVGGMSTLVVPNPKMPASALNYQPNTSTSNNTYNAQGNTTSIIDTSAEINTAITAGQQSGWISAGSYYFILNRTLNSQLFNTVATVNSIASSAIPACDANCYNNFYGSGETLNASPAANGFITDTTGGAVNSSLLAAGLAQPYIDKMSQYLAWGQAYIKIDGQSSSSTTTNFSLAAYTNNPLQGSPAEAMWGNISNMTSSMLQNMTNTMQNVSQGADPLYANVVFGYNTMVVCETLWAVLLVGGFTFALSFGLEAASVSMWLAAVIFALGGLIGTFWAIGASLAIYCPLIPFMMFTMGVIGWLLTVVEAIIAAPIVALALVMPEGDELDKISVALGILTTIFLRPTLMIFGFLLASRVYYAIVQLIDSTIFNVFKTINVNTMFSFVIIFFAYTSFIISITNTSFSLIYALPDKIMRWIGITGEQTEVGAMQEVKKASQQAAGATAKQAQGGADQAVQTGAKDHKERMEAKRDAAKKP